MQQQLVALGLAAGWAPGQSLLQQGYAAFAVALAHLQAAEFGAGVGISRLGGQVGLHGLAQPLRLGAAGQQITAVAIVGQGRHSAIRQLPVGLLFQQGQHAVIHHRVVGPAPVDGWMAAKQAAHI